MQIASAQYIPDQRTSDTANLYVPKMSLKLDLASLLSPNDPSLLLYGEYYYTDKISFNLYGGKVLNLRDHYDSQVVNKHFEGLKVGQEMRYFFEESGYGGKVFIGLNTQYRYLSIYDRYTLGFGCETGDCDYYKNFIGTIKTDRFSYEFKLGFMSELSGRMLVEFDYGFGYHNLKVRRNSINFWWVTWLILRGI